MADLYLLIITIEIIENAFSVDLKEEDIWMN